jgi:hypothetical protein
MRSSSPPFGYMPCPSHPPWLDHSNYSERRVQVMKLLIMQFSSTCRCRSTTDNYLQIRDSKTLLLQHCVLAKKLIKANS